MIRTLALVVVLGSAAPHSAADDAEAEAILDKGSALFDKKDAAAMAATYTEDAQVLVLGRSGKSGRFTTDVKKGRSEIEDLYRDMFNNGGKSTAKNVVEFAKRIAPDVLVIHGTFRPDVSRPEVFPFVQVRVKQGDAWLIKRLQFFAVSRD